MITAGISAIPASPTSSPISDNPGPEVAFVRIALEDHLLDLVRVDAQQPADEPHRDHVLAPPAAARLLRERAEWHLRRARLEFGRDLHRLGVADDVPVRRQLVVMEV